jgi:hypothetical protein
VNVIGVFLDVEKQSFAMKTENARKMTEMAQRWGLASQGPRSAIVCAIHQLLADVGNRPHLSIGLSACDAIDQVIYV